MKVKYEDRLKQKVIAITPDTLVVGLNKRKNALKNTITAVLDEFFPEYEEVFKHPPYKQSVPAYIKNLPIP